METTGQSPGLGIKYYLVFLIIVVIIVILVILNILVKFGMPLWAHNIFYIETNWFVTIFKCGHFFQIYKMVLKFERYWKWTLCIGKK